MSRPNASRVTAAETWPEQVLVGLDRVDVGTRVAAEQLLLGRRAAFLPRKRGLQRGEPLGALRVVSGRMEMRERAVAQDVDLTASASSSRLPPPPTATPTR